MTGGARPRLAARTGLAAFAAALLSLLVLVPLFQRLAGRALLDRVDTQLELRADTAPILVVTAERLSQSELNGVTEGAQVATEGQLVAVGNLPDDPLPAPAEPGFATARADGERWRLLTVAVDDVPRVGDEALVQLVAPLGDVETQARVLRRRATVAGFVAALAAAAIGAIAGTYAARPLSALRRDAAALDDRDPDRWRVADAYGSPDVDDIAHALNTTFGRLATETRRRGEALSSARSFASAATHELRVPLQGALTNLNVAADDRLGDDDRRQLVERAAEQIARMGTALGAVRDLTQAELVDDDAFAPHDLADVVDAAVAQEARGGEPPVEIIAPSDDDAQRIWADGVGLAVTNLVRNAGTHGRRPDGTPPRVTVTIAGATVTVDDDGPGIPPTDRRHLVERFARGPDSTGSGLGLAIAAQVAAAHGGGLTLDASPLGGTRAVLTLAPAGGQPPPAENEGPGESNREGPIA